MSHASNVGTVASLVKAFMPFALRQHTEVSKTTLEVLAENLARLKAEHSELTSQAAIAKAADIDQRTVGRILNKEHAPRSEQIDALARAFGVTPWQLVTPDLAPAPKSFADLKGPEAQLVMLFRQLDSAKQTEAVAAFASFVLDQTRHPLEGVAQNVTNRRVEAKPVKKERRRQPFTYEGGISNVFDRELSEAHKRKVRGGAR